MIVKDDKDVHFVSTRYKEIKNKLLNKHSQCETKFAELLIDNGFYFIREKCDYKIGNRWSYYDFFIPSLRLYIEIDGEEHSAPKQQMIDAQKKRQVVAHLNRLIRYTNKEVLEMSGVSLNDFFDRVHESIKKRKTRILNLFKQNIIDSAAQVWVTTNQAFGYEASFKQYFLYNAERNTIYAFENLGYLRIATGLSVKEVRAILARKNNNRATKYIVSTELGKCQESVVSRFGVAPDRIIEWTFPHFTRESNNKIFTSEYMFKRAADEETLRCEDFDRFIQNKTEYYALKDSSRVIIPDYERRTFLSKERD